MTTSNTPDGRTKMNWNNIPPDAERTGDKGLLKSLKEDAMMDEAIASASLSESDTPPLTGLRRD